MTDRNTERTRQTLEALAMVDYWRNEAEQQRTRAEAAEQELREVKESTRVGLAACTAAAFKDADKLAAIRAHLKGVDMKHATMLFDCMERVSHATTRLLLAAAREALEP